MAGVWFIWHCVDHNLQQIFRSICKSNTQMEHLDKIDYWLVVFSHPVLKNDGLRQLGWWHKPNISGKIKKCSKPPTRIKIAPGSKLHGTCNPCLLSWKRSWNQKATFTDLSILWSSIYTSYLGWFLLLAFHALPPKISAWNLAEINFISFTGDIPISACYIPMESNLKPCWPSPNRSILLVKHWCSLLICTPVIKRRNGNSSKNGGFFHGKKRPSLDPWPRHDCVKRRVAIKCDSCPLLGGSSHLISG